MRWFLGCIVAVVIVAGAIDEPWFVAAMVGLVFVLPQALFFFLRETLDGSQEAFAYYASAAAVVFGIAGSGALWFPMHNHESSGLVMMMTALSLGGASLFLLRVYDES